MESLTAPSRRSFAKRGARPVGAWSTRGFTLIEMMTVVIIIGIFAALAIPQVYLQLRDKRTHEAAQRVSLIYQQARVRAMGIGGAVLVRFIATSNTIGGTFETRDALMPTTAGVTCGLSPSVSCTNPTEQFDTPTRWRSLGVMDFSTGAGMDNVSVSLAKEDGTSSSTMDLCFTPLGRSFVRYANTGPWLPLTGVPTVTIVRTDGTSPVGLARKVLILPTGIARLQL